MAMSSLSSITSITKHIIDLDTEPLACSEMTIRSEDQVPNVIQGKFEWDPRKISLYGSPRQQQGELLERYKVQMELEHKMLFSANLLQYLLVHTEIIPEEWKRNEENKTRHVYILFHGTRYRRVHDGKLFVPCLYWDGNRWTSLYLWLGLEWGDDCLTAVLAD